MRFEMRRNSFYLISVIIVMAIAMAGCGEDAAGPGEIPDPAENVTRIWIEGPLWVVYGNTAQMKAFVLLEDGSKKEITNQATWKMADPNTATIDNKGFATSYEPGSTEIRLTYGSITFVDPFLVATRGIGVGGIRFDDVTPLTDIIQFSGAGATKQIVATLRMPNGVTIDLTDRATFDSQNPSAISVDPYGMAEAHVSQGASEFWAYWRGYFGFVTLQVGAPLPKDYDIYVEPFKFAAPNSCDSATNADGGDGEFSYEINVIDPTGQRRKVYGTDNYPSENNVIHIDQNGSLILDGPQTHVVLSEIQALEVEVRVTEWDLQWVDLGDPIREPEMDDMTDSLVFRGSAGFSPGVHTISLVGSADCEVEVSFRIIARER